MAAYTKARIQTLWIGEQVGVDGPRFRKFRSDLCFYGCRIIRSKMFFVIHTGR